MRIIALYGPSGAGKTHERTADKELSALPCVDLGDVVIDLKKRPRLDTFDNMMKMFIRRIVACGAPVVLVEGHFLPRSASRKAFLRWAQRAGHTVEWREVTAPIDVRRERLQKCIDADVPYAVQRLRHLERDRRRYGV